MNIGKTIRIRGELTGNEDMLFEGEIDGKIDLDGFVSHRLTLDEVNKGFELMEARDGIRSVIQF